MPKSAVQPALLDGSPLSSVLNWYPAPCRPYSRRELLADRIVSFSMAAAAWPLAIVLSVHSLLEGDPPLVQLCHLLFGAGLIAMSNCSASFHYWSYDHQRANRLYSLDQLGINALLMGSYAPVCCGCQMYWCLLGVWLLGSFGLYNEGYLYFVAETVPKRDRGFNLNDVRFLLMGWAGLPVLSAMWSTFSEFAVQCILLGGFFYTGGFVFLVFPRLEYHQALWHLSVFLAAISHYVAMWNIRMEASPM